MENPRDVDNIPISKAVLLYSHHFDYAPAQFKVLHAQDDRTAHINLSRSDGADKAYWDRMSLDTKIVYLVHAVLKAIKEDPRLCAVQAHSELIRIIEYRETVGTWINALLLGVLQKDR